ncbi:tRNA methyltransferase 11 homolog (Saccharomyces cerevisiae) [Seminavis robusta]|uniref:tRNA methyltransferase 11 homolog (Saccharomyces cerevisiae) n=1 Tax=Seminavis robusta TaxID=568900 RepID=A0A9N8EYL5_9STRA|nr:tRNA methyltransferase 11 homolog (Saccharomyces cerevisiae) [Seminavis robusta]|eukprot:Sro2201_g318870.1 tRNA methyltransferase 11 homolog (Saccharomyces cerevisiae) (715) ;mRNA; f:2046-4286
MSEEGDTTQPRYRGGFSSSIWDGLFENHDEIHSDCCALTCCGILLYDRSAYLLTDQRPSWKGRCCSAFMYCCVLLALFLVALFRIALRTQHDDGRKGHDSTLAPQDVEFDNMLEKAAYILLILFAALSFYFLYSAVNHRLHLRRALMCKMYEERGEPESRVETEVPTAATPLVPSNNNNNLQTFLQAEESYMVSSTSVCGCLGIDGTPPGNNPAAADTCYWMWKALGAMFCGACCSCWCQCCGLCAMAQEDRELQRMLPKKNFQMDYITFQPFEAYFPKLQQLRDDRVNNPFAHMKELSQLSSHLTRIFLIVLAFLAVLALSGLDPLFQLPNLGVVGLLFLQAFIIITLVHWIWNRFDISFDALVKFFASGFLLGTTNALVYETIVSTLLSAGGIVLGWVWLFFMVLTGTVDVDDDDNAPSTGSSLTYALNYYAMKAHKEDPTLEAPVLPAWVLVIMAFLNAFVVAALVEETVKYFGYWMVEHPDLMVPCEAPPTHSDENGNNDRGEASEAEVSTDGSSLTVPTSRSLRSVGAGITIAMVTTACGFACCENFLYVFFYSGPTSAAQEVGTLVVRSMFPVHPLAAALQSIGVCRRDLEKDHSMGMGKVLLPALLLHGFFDFSLMFLQLLTQSSILGWVGSWFIQSAVGKVPTEPSTPLDDPSQEEVTASMAAMTSCVMTVCVGFIYYFAMAIAQRKRLVELDEERRRTDGYEQLH